jgi:hypothetical protein
MYSVCTNVPKKHVECAKLCKKVYTQKNDILIRYNKKEHDLIVAIEGSDTLVNWYDNLSVCKRTDDVHVGFRKYATHCKKKYKLHTTLQKYKDAKIYICGHSLGSAAAALIANDLHNQYDIDLIVFGCPKIGGHAFKKRFMSNSVSTFNYQNTHDIVSKLPFNALGYTQMTDNIIELYPGYRPHEILKNHDIDTYIEMLEHNL